MFSLFLFSQNILMTVKTCFSTITWYWGATALPSLLLYGTISSGAPSSQPHNGLNIMRNFC